MPTDWHEPNPPCHHGVVPALLKPLTGYVPTSNLGHRVAAPPNSMLTSKQREAATHEPLSFRNALGRGAGASHEEAGAWIEESSKQGALQPVSRSIIVYRQGRGGHAATGVVADVSLDAYDSGLVKPHEETIAKTARKMADYMRTTRIYGNAVALTHRPLPDFQAAIAAHAEGPPTSEFATPDGMSHQLWLVAGDDAESLCRSFDAMLYVTDGHHRLAAASLVASEEGRTDPRLPAALFPSAALTVRSFARCITDPELDAADIVARLGSAFSLESVDELAARPRHRGEFGMRIKDAFYRLRMDPAYRSSNPHRSLDVDLLQEEVLGPIFGITDPSSDRRLRFVADLSEEHQPDTESDCWLLPFPVGIGDVMAVADTGQVMPPKSTWLAPKVPSGLVIRSCAE